MRDLTALIDQCQQLNAQGNGNEEIVALLRAQGCSKVESIVVLVKALKSENRKAKEIVHLSKTWADVRERDDQFHEALVKASENEPDV